MKEFKPPPEFGHAETASTVQAVPAAALKMLLDHCAEGICLVAPPTWEIVFANTAFVSESARSGGSCPSRNLADWLPPAELAAVLDRLAEVASGDLDETSFPGRIAATGGNEAAAEFVARRIEADGRVLLSIVVRKAVSSLPASGAGTQIDPLTGLADRAFLTERLRSLVEGERSRDQQCAVLFVDVDGFKQVNDAYGHLVGDRVLCEVARRLAECVRSDDHVTRFGGDEFVVLLEHVSGRGEIQPVVDRIDAAFERPIELSACTVTLTVSVGVARAKRSGQTADELLDAADRAMYAAKRATT